MTVSYSGLRRVLRAALDSFCESEYGRKLDELEPSERAAVLSASDAEIGKLCYRAQKSAQMQRAIARGQR